MSKQVNDEFSSLILNATFDAGAFQTYSTRYQEEFIIIGLLWSLYGMCFTIGTSFRFTERYLGALATLSIISCYALITQCVFYENS